MDVYHQAGHNLIWNLDSLTQDGAGDGIIFSPVNQDPEKISGIDKKIKANSFFDPQFYLPESSRGKLTEYPFFPSTYLDEFSTADFETVCWNIAASCVQFQIEAGFKTIIIPARYFAEIPSNYMHQIKSCYNEPFVKAAKELGFEGKILQTLIVKSGQLTDDEQRKLLLNWITGFQDIDGVYLIFEHNSLTKQVKSPIFLADCLKFIRSLKDNDLSVHVGYNNTEGLLFSLAYPDSITMGAYENLRAFNHSRFKDKEGQKGGQPPNPRLYSGALLQWVEFTYIQAIQQLYPAWEKLFEDSKYKPMDFKPGHAWNLKQPELYKHFFTTFYRQAKSLPENNKDRIDYLKHAIIESRQAFKDIEEAGVVLDENSDGSHLSAWLTAINIYEKT